MHLFIQLCCEFARNFCYIENSEHAPQKPLRKNQSVFKWQMCMLQLLHVRKFSRLAWLFTHSKLNYTTTYLGNERPQSSHPEVHSQSLCRLTKLFFKELGRWPKQRHSKVLGWDAASQFSMPIFILFGVSKMAMKWSISFRSTGSCFLIFDFWLDLGYFCVWLPLVCFGFLFFFFPS